MRKNLGNFSSVYFQERVLEISTKIEYILRNYCKTLKKFIQFLRNLSKTLIEIFSCQEFLKYYYDIPMKFWNSFREIKCNFYKNVHKNFIKIMKICWKNMKTLRVRIFEEINFWMRKKDDFGKFLIELEKSCVKKFKDSLWIREFVKCPAKFQKVLEMLRIFQKNFEEIR